MEKIEVGTERELSAIIEEFGLEDKEVFFMGSIHNIYPLLKILDSRNLSMAGIVDNDRSKAGTHMFRGIAYEIYTTEVFFNRPKSGIVLIIISERFWCEMREQMIREGYTEGENLFVLNAVTYEKKYRYIRKADCLIQEYQRKYGEDVFLILFYGPVGDNYLFALFLREYLKDKGIENYLCIGTGAARKICRLFGFTEFEQLDREEIVALEYWYMFLDGEASMLKVLQIWDWTFHLNRDRIRFDRRFSFIDTFRNYVFGLGNTAMPEIPQFYCDRALIRKEFEEKGLEKGNTVILAPYAYSIDCPPEKFWIFLSDYLEDLGIKVAINIDPMSIHEEEKNYIPNARILSFELSESVPYLEYAGFFIGMRSGLCDVTSSAKCRKIILYPLMGKIDYDRHRPDKEFGSLQEMGLCKEVTELELDMEENLDYWRQQAERIVFMLAGEREDL